MSSLLAGWSRALLVVQALLCVPAVGLIVFGIVLIISDERSHGEDWDGFGTFIGLVVGGLALMFVAVLLALFALTRFARTHERRMQLALAAVISLLVALIFIAGMARISGNAPPTAVAVHCLPGFVLAVPALGTLLSVRTSHPARDRSPGWPPA